MHKLLTGTCMYRVDVNFDANYIDTPRELFSFWCITKNWNLRLTRKNLDGSKLSYKYIILDLFLEF